ncbi:hypothetical protein ACQ4LE_007662 [Meloidogyne hapla]
MVNLRLFSRLISAKELNEKGVATVSKACETIVQMLQFNLLVLRFKHTGNQMAALEGMLKHQLLWNFIHDEGHDEGRLLEEDEEDKENLPSNI